MGWYCLEQGVIFISATQNDNKNKNIALESFKLSFVNNMIRRQNNNKEQNIRKPNYERKEPFSLLRNI